MLSEYHMNSTVRQAKWCLLFMVLLASHGKTRPEHHLSGKILSPALSKLISLKAFSFPHRLNTLDVTQLMAEWGSHVRSCRHQPQLRLKPWLTKTALSWEVPFHSHRLHPSDRWGHRNSFRWLSTVLSLQLLWRIVSVLFFYSTVTLQWCANTACHLMLQHVVSYPWLYHTLSCAADIKSLIFKSCSSALTV